MYLESRKFFQRDCRSAFLPKSKHKDATFFPLLSGFYISKMLDKMGTLAIMVFVYFIKQISFYSILSLIYEDR